MLGCCWFWVFLFFVVAYLCWNVDFILFSCSYAWHCCADFWQIWAAFLSCRCLSVGSTESRYKTSSRTCGGLTPLRRWAIPYTISFHLAKRISLICWTIVTEYCIFMCCSIQSSSIFNRVIRSVQTFGFQQAFSCHSFDSYAQTVLLDLGLLYRWIRACGRRTKSVRCRQT